MLLEGNEIYNSFRRMDDTPMTRSGNKAQIPGFKLLEMGDNFLFLSGEEKPALFFPSLD